MNKEDVTKLFKTAQKFVSKRSPEILTGVGLVGMVATTVLAVKATPKAMALIEEEQKKRTKEKYEENRKTDPNINGAPAETLSTLDKVKVAWKPYIPAAITGVLSIGCIVGASSVSARRQAALYSAYKLSETAFAEYKDKVAETVSEKKVKEIKQKIAEDKVDKATDPESKTKVVLSSDGDTWFIDPYSNIKFLSTANKIDMAANKLSRKMLDEMYVSLDEFYDELGIDPSDRTKTSNDIGWHIDDGVIEPDYSDAVVKDGKAYVVLDFLKRPEYGFDDKSKLYS